MILWNNLPGGSSPTKPSRKIFCTFITIYKA
jgi:hypothetical protein